MERTSKTFLGALTYIFTFLTQSINEVFVVLAILMIFDYIMGVIRAIRNKSFNYDVGIWGVIKKLLYVMIIATGYLADFLVNYLVNKLGLNFKTYGSLGFVIVFYLIGNEGISLYKHWIFLGLPVPSIFLYVFKNFKSIAKDEEYQKIKNKSKKNQ